jgi:hypothetical protein
MKLVSKWLAFLTTESLVKLFNHTLEQHGYIFPYIYALHVHKKMSDNK